MSPADASLSSEESARRYEAERPARERLALVLEVTRLGTWDWNLATGELWWDARCREIHGVPIGSPVDYGTLARCIHPDERDRVEREIAATRAGGVGDFASEFRICRIDDRAVRWVEARGRCLYDAAGAPMRVVGTVNDVTEHKLAEQRLRDDSLLNETLHRLGTQLHEELDQKRLVQLVTDMATKLCGAEFGALFWRDPEPSGEAFLPYTQSGAPREAFSRYRMARTTPVFGPTFRGEATIRLADVREDPRSAAWAPQPEDLPMRSYLGVPVVTPQREVLGGLFFGHSKPGQFTDMHQRLVEGVAAQAAVALENARLYRTVKSKEKELSRALLQAKDADRRKDEFLAMLGHELRNPLAPILTALELMRLRGGGSERERNVIERQVRHVVRLVDDLLDVSRITRGKVELKRERVELAEVVAKAVETASPALEQKSHRLHVDVPREGLPIDANPVRMTQVVANLLTNAAKYTEAWGDVWLTAKREGAEVTLSVRDSGIGIEPELLANVFEPFTQASRALDRAEGGLGIGLALVKNLTALHGGTVVASSAGPGMGSEFTLRLPAATASRAQPEHAPPRAHAPPEAPRTGAVRLMVVDDNTDAAELLAEALASDGYDVRVAYDGPSALTLARDYPPDVCLLDIGLPVMDGYELGRRLHDAGIRPPELIAITGYGQEEDRQRSELAGFAAHFVKPIDLEKVVETIEQLASQDRG